MEYKKFKKRLYQTIVRREELAGKKILLGEDSDELYIVGGEGEAFALCWKLEALFKEFQESSWKSLADRIICRVRLQYFVQKKPLIVRPLNCFNNREELKDAVYWCQGDIALVVHTLLYELEHEYVTVKIQQSELDCWGIPVSELVTEALNITCRMRPPRLYSGTELYSLLDLESGAFMETVAECLNDICDGSKEEGMKGYRLTAVGQRYGAVAFFYPGVRERLAQLLEGDYYVGFPSVHEAVIHPVRYKGLQDMQKALVRANAVLDVRERLTNRIYRYCNAQKRLTEV